MNTEELKKRIRNELGTSYILIVIAIALIGLLFKNNKILYYLIEFSAPIIAMLIFINTKLKKTKQFITNENFKAITGTLVSTLIVITIFGVVIAGTSSIVYLIVSIIIFMYLKPKNNSTQ